MSSTQQAVGRTEDGLMEMGPAGTGRLVVSLAVLGMLAVLVWRTIDPGKVQQVTWLILGFFAFRIVLGWMRSRRMEAGEAEGSQSQSEVR